MKLYGDKEYKTIDRWDSESGTHYDLLQTVSAAPGEGDAIAIRNNEIDALLMYYEADGLFPPSRDAVEQDFKDNDELHQWERERHFEFLKENCHKPSSVGGEEFTREDIVIDPDLEYGDNPNEIVAYIETWFDVDAKFDLNTKERDDEWLNMYAHFEPFKDTLKIECVVSNDEEEHSFQYTPTKAEKKLITKMIEETLQEMYGQTPEEFCREALEEN